MDSAVYYPAVLRFRQYSKASLDHISLTSKAYCQGEGSISRQNIYFYLGYTEQGSDFNFVQKYQ
jgi:hypothetical protein